MTRLSGMLPSSGFYTLTGPRTNHRLIQHEKNGRYPQVYQPSTRAVGLVDSYPSAGVRPQKPAQIHADPERVAVELQRNAAAKVEFKVKVADRFVINSGVVTVVACEVRSPRRNAAGCVALAVSAAAAPAALCSGCATEDPADFGLISPRCDVIGCHREAEFAWVVFNAAVKLRVITVSGNEPVKVFCVHDGVAYPGVDERGKIAEGVIEVVRLIPSRMADAEAFLLVACRSCQVDSGTIIQ